MSNIEAFNRGVALALGKLYDVFPQRINLAARDLEPGVDKETAAIYADTMRWLQEEGFIRSHDVASQLGASEHCILLSAVLTSKGIDVLNAEPDALQDKQPLGQKINHALKAGSAEVIKTLVNQVISAAVSGYIKPG